MAVQEIDQARAEEFGGRLLGTVSGAMLALAVSVGHRTGVYDALAELDPATSDEIAERTGLQERYIREWLAGQLAGGIVEYDAEAGTWWLPRENALSLTRAAGAHNLGILASAVVETSESAMAECLTKAGPLAGTLDATNWEIFEAIAKLTDERKPSGATSAGSFFWGGDASQRCLTARQSFST